MTEDDGAASVRQGLRARLLDMKPRPTKVCAICNNDDWRALCEEFAQMKAEGETVTIAALHRIMRDDYEYPHTDGAVRQHLDNHVRRPEG